MGPSRSSRRNATVISSHPEASMAASIAESLVYLPVPRNRRERRVTPATTNGSVCVRVCTRESLRELHRHPLPSGERGVGRGYLEVLLQEQRLVAAVGQPFHGVLGRQPQ